MLKLSQIGKNLLLPAATLLAVFVAAGSVVTVATTSTSTGTETETPVDNQASPTLLTEFCSQYWGDMIEHGRYCRFEQWIHLNLKHAGNEPVIIGIPILAGDTLRVEASALPEIEIGGMTYDASEEKILTASSGYLSFRAPQHQGIFSVERLGLERCFAVNEGRVDSVPCP